MELAFEGAGGADGDDAGGVEIGAEDAEAFHVAVFGGFDESEDDVRALRKKLGIMPSFRLMDTCACAALTCR